MTAHEHTTAHIVSSAAAALGLSDRLRLHQVGRCELKPVVNANPC